jgi:hypothetical protein
MYMWKCQKETPCGAILNKQKWLFLKNGEQGGKSGPVWELAPEGGGRIKGKGVGG